MNIFLIIALSVILDAQSYDKPVEAVHNRGDMFWVLFNPPDSCNIVEYRISRDTTEIGVVLPVENGSIPLIDWHTGDLERGEHYITLITDCGSIVRKITVGNFISNPVVFWKE